jgi:hypothetical protein
MQRNSKGIANTTQNAYLLVIEELDSGRRG